MSIYNQGSGPQGIGAPPPPFPGPGLFLQSQAGPRQPKTTPRRPKTPQEAPRRQQDGARRLQDEPRRRQDGPRRAKTPPRKPQTLPRRLHYGPRCSQNAIEIDFGCFLLFFGGWVLSLSYVFGSRCGIDIFPKLCLELDLKYI